MTEKADSTRSLPDVLLSWDRLGFRLLIFGGLALMWILDGRLVGQPWSDLVRREGGGLLPWAFLAPMVLAVDRRARQGRPGALRYLATHAVGMALVFPPYWAILRMIGFAWRCAISGWQPAHARVFVPTAQNLLGTLLNVPFVYLIIVLGAAAMASARERQEEAVLADRLARQLTDAKLALLQRQLHPHFLFNALQAISTLIHRDPATADQLLVRLSDLLRTMLDEGAGASLALRQELDLARKYLDIEQVRFGDRLDVRWNVDVALLDAAVPSLVILPLVENAVRHGLAPKTGRGRLTIDVRQEHAALIVTVEDDGVGATLPIAAGLGIGNTRERLSALYGAGAGIEVETAPHAGFLARLRMPLHRGHA
jgi:two-component system, LytTR family, sensor kinase